MIFSKKNDALFGSEAERIQNRRAWSVADHLRLACTTGGPAGDSVRVAWVYQATQASIPDNPPVNKQFAIDNGHRNIFCGFSIVNDDFP